MPYWLHPEDLPASSPNSCIEKGNQDVVVLAKEMFDNNLSLGVSFVDEECGFLVLYEMDGNIIPIVDSEVGPYSLQFVAGKSADYEYTRENLMKLDCQQEFEVELKDILGALDSHSAKEAIEIWLNQNPFICSTEDAIKEMRDSGVL